MLWFDPSWASSSRSVPVTDVLGQDATQPYCTAFGVHRRKAVLPYDTPKVDNAFHCFTHCFESVRTARKGFVLYQEANFINPKLFYPRKPGHINQLPDNEISSVKVFPCTFVKLFQGPVWNDKSRTYDQREAHWTFTDDYEIPRKQDINNQISSYYKLDSSGSFCDLARNTANGQGPLCTQWVWDDSTSTCSLYASDNMKVTDTIEYRDIPGSFSGYTNCRAKLREAAFDIFNSPGCVSKDHTLAATNQRYREISGLYYTHSCRNRCNKDSSCIWFIHDTRARTCSLYTGSSARDLQRKNKESDHIFLGSRLCSTCVQSFYLPDGDTKCRICTRGYYCPGGVDRVECPVGYYCPTDLLAAPKKCDISAKEFCPYRGMKEPLLQCTGDKYGSLCQYNVTCIETGSRGQCDLATEENPGACFGFEGNGMCSSCSINAAGRICEHNVCANSELARRPEVLGSHDKAPIEFNFGLYKAENVRVEQGWNDNDRPSMKVFLRSISSDIDSHTVSVVRLGSNKKTAELTSAADCSITEPEVVIFDDYRSSVGTEVGVEVKGFWSSAKQELRSGTWESLDDKSRLARPNPTVALTYTTRFQTQMIITARDRSNTIGIEVTVGLLVGGKYFEVETTALGVINAQFVLPENIGSDGRPISLTILNATSTIGSESDIALCTVQPSGEGIECPQYEELPYNKNGDLRVSHQPGGLSLTAPPIPRYFLFDRSAVIISGHIRSIGLGSRSCFIRNVKVEAVNLRDPAKGVLGKATSGPDGKFELTVPKNSKVQLKFDYLNHTIIADDSNVDSQSIVAARGLDMGVTKSGLEFIDIETRTLTVTAVATDCGYSLGRFTFSLSGSCGELTRRQDEISSSNTLTLELPAQTFEYDMEFVSVNGADQTTVKQQFVYAHPSRHLNLSSDNQAIKFIYHPEPVVKMSVLEGSFFDYRLFRVFPTEDCEDAEPSHFALQSNSIATFMYEVYQEYSRLVGDAKQICRSIPEGTEIGVIPTLGVQDDPCSGTTGGCYYKLKVGEFRGINRSFAIVDVPVGQASADTTSWYVEYHVNNSVVWDPSVEPLLPKLHNNKTVILGNKYLTSNTVVSFFAEGQDHTPLLYLYQPPPSGSSQSVSLELNVATTKEVFQNENIEAGGGASLGIKASGEGKICIPFSGCPIKVFQTEFAASFGASSFTGDTLTFTNNVQTIVESDSFEIATEGDDLVLLLGSSAKFVSSKFISFNESGCSLETEDSIAWGSKAESLLVKTRGSIDDDITKLAATRRVHTQRLNDASLSQSQRDASKELVITSNNSIVHWNSLLSHWDTDRLQARSNPVNLLAPAEGSTIYQAGGTGVSRITLAQAGITMTKESEMSDSSVVDYQSTTTVHNLNAEANFELLFGAGGLVGITGSTFAEVTTVSESTFINTREQSNKISVSASFGAQGDGEEICLDVYESPYSGTFVFDVCGGRTKCPHIPGTDPIQGFILSVKDAPKGILSSDDGRFILAVRPEPELGANEELEIKIQLEAQTSGSPVTYHIGGLSGESLSTPFMTTLRGPTSQFEFNVFFQRSLSTVQQTTVSGSVSAACDGSISAPFRFETRWQSSCPAVGWGGELSDPQSHFKITQQHPDLLLTASSFNSNWAASSSTSVDVSLWVRRFEPASSEWQKVENKYLRLSKDSDTSSSFINNLDDNGFSSLFISAYPEIFRDGERYLLELRAVCTNGEGKLIGSTRSGGRLGIVDMRGPALISQTSTVKIKAAVAEFPIARMLFSEPIDCASRSLRSRVFAVNTTKIEGQSEVYCSSNMHQLHVVLKIESEEEAAVWSGATIEVEVLGVQDLHGNLFGVNGRLSIASRRLEEMNKIALDFHAPDIPLELGFQARKWQNLTQAELEGLIHREMENILPAAYVHSSTHFVDEGLDFSGGSVADDSGTIAGAIGGSFAAVLAIAFLAYAQSKHWLPISKGQVEQRVVETPTPEAQQKKVIKPEV